MDKKFDKEFVDMQAELEKAKEAQRSERKLQRKQSTLVAILQKLVVKKLRVTGCASEDKEEWMEEVKAHCERCYDDKDENSEVQAERIREQRRGGDCLVTWQGRTVAITVERVIRARGKMMKKKANGPGVENYTSVFLKKPDATLEKGLRGFRAIALMSVRFLRNRAVLVGLSNDVKELVEWEGLHVGAEREVNCGHMLASLTNILFCGIGGCSNRTSSQKKDVT